MDCGYEVRQACDGNAAVVALAEKAPDCVVLDLMMPGMDGFDVLRAKRERDLAPETRVMILTCMTGERDYVKGWELGADEYVSKPFDPERLVLAIANLMAVPVAELAARRDAELSKAEMLSRLETVFTRSGSDRP
jgi:DNA-binding response OmpR family regulator